MKSASLMTLTLIALVLGLLLCGSADAAQQQDETHLRFALREFAESLETEALDASGSNATSSSSGSTGAYYDWQSIVFALMLIGFGIAYCFFGYKLFHILLFVLGWVLGTVIFYNVLDEHTQLKTWIVIVIAVVVGIACGVLAIIFYFVGIFLLGALLGLIFITSILSVREGTLIHNQTVRIVVVVSVSLAFAIAALLLQRIMIIVATGVSGAYWIVSGIDYLIKGNLSAFIPEMFRGNLDNLQPNWKTWLMLAFLIVLSIAGITVQLVKTAKDHEFTPMVNADRFKCWKKKKHEVHDVESPEYHLLKTPQAH
eukprot:TRINITY_DN887_c0_g1_i1.p1 TRINITY_DN887_c0_g1~~TRINITY_DN887_c0_g1_i1.p1  ORF type:complete len:313 (-),score=78.74 TRINITY_DN887_c0_g1_i1:75-1013(-)